MQSTAGTWARRGPGAWLVGALLAPALFFGAATGPATAATGGPTGTVTCNVWVSGSGNNATGNGTKAAPYLTIPFVLSRPSVPVGLYTVCLVSWTTLPIGLYALARSNTVLSGDPAGGALPQLNGQLTVTGNDVTVRGVKISFDSQNVDEMSGALRMYGDRATLADSSITAANGSCVEVGFLDQGVQPNEALDVDFPPQHVSQIVVRGNDIGPCASAPAFLQQWDCSYSGLPGIYSQWVEDLDILDNVIHDTALRGIQLFPKNERVLVKDNLLRRNSIGMNIGTSGSGPALSTHRARDITVESNVFADQTSASLAAQYPNMRLPGCAGDKYLGGNQPGMTIDDEATEYTLPGQPLMVPTVTITDNCGEGVSKQEAHSTFVWTGETNKDVNATFAPGSDRLVAGNDCVGYGPDRIQPAGLPPSPIEVMQLIEPVATIGELVHHGFAVTNFGQTTRSVTLTASMTTAGPSPALAAYRRLEGPGCGQTSCTVTLAPDDSLGFEVTYAAARGNGTKLRTILTATSSGVQDASATNETTVGGSFCTAPYGTTGNNTLTAPAAFNGTILCGFEGDDTLIPGKGGDQLRGGEGTDTAAYDLAAPADANPWRIDLAAGTANRIPTDSVNSDQLVSMESARGTANSDVLIGSTGDNVLIGGNGNDTILGGLGNDTVVGSGGVDTASYAGTVAPVTVRLAVATPQATGGAGTDTITSTENAIGGNGNDALYGTTGPNRLDGGSGNDTVNGGGADDVMIGGLGIDTVSYTGTGAGVKVLLSVTAQQNTGGAGLDTISGLENAVGGNGNDDLRGTATANTLSGGLGNDSLAGGGGNDTLLGGAGNDTLDGGTGTDVCDQATGTGVKTSCP